MSGLALMPACAAVVAQIAKSSWCTAVSVDGAMRYNWPVSTGRRGYGTQRTAPYADRDFELTRLAWAAVFNRPITLSIIDEISRAKTVIRAFIVQS